MRIEKQDRGYTLRYAPSDSAASVVILALAALALFLVFAEPDWTFFETAMLLVGCGLFATVGIQGLIRERRNRLTVTNEGIRAYNRRTRGDELLRWEDIRDWGTAVLLHKGRHGLYHPRVLLFFSDILRATAEDASTCSHIIELMKFDREALEESGFLPYCRECLISAQGDNAPTERDQWLTAGHD